MKTVTTRRLALLGATTTTAVLAGMLVAPSATAAITQISPPSTVNSDASRQITLTTSGSTSDYRFGGSLTLTHGGATAATYTVAIMPNPAPAAEKSPTATLTPADTGQGLGQDGPLDAGDYKVTATATGAPVTSTGAGSDSCAAVTCFTVQAALPAEPVLVASVAPGAARAGDSLDVALAGDNFERRSRVEVLLPDGSGPDPLINANQPPVGANAGTADDDSTQGITTRSTLKRRITVGATAATGARDVRVTNLDGRTGVCTKCFSVDGAPLTGTSTSAGDNDPSLGLRDITFFGTGLNAQGRPTLLYTADPGSSTRDALTITGTSPRGATSTQVTADFDLRNAAPGLYTPAVRNPDGSTNACACRFQVTQQGGPSRTTTVTSLDSATGTAGTQKTQQAGTTQTFVVTGTGFSRGTRVTVSGAGVTTTAVEFVSATTLRATFQSTSAAAPGDRNVTATRTDGVTSAPCTGCYTVTAAASASPSATPTSTTSPRPSASPGTPEAPTVNVSPRTITAGQRAVVSGTAAPGSRIEVRAYSRPRTEYQVVRSAVVGEDGTYSFDVGPSGNTRLFARTVTSSGSADSGSTVLTVRTSINLKVARTGTRTYRFTGSTLPKRAGQTVNVRYRSGSGTVVASKARVASNGTYNVTRTFSGTGTFTFFTDTGTDINNAAGTSNAVRTTVR